MLGAVIRAISEVAYKIDDFAYRLDERFSRFAYGNLGSPRARSHTRLADTPFAGMPQIHRNSPVDPYAQQYNGAQPAMNGHVIRPLQTPPALATRDVRVHASVVAGRRRHASMLAAEKRCVDHFLRALPLIDLDFDVAGTPHAREASVEYDALEPGIREVYETTGGGQAQYLREVASERTTRTEIDHALKCSGMYAVPNDGITPKGRNNCLFLSILHFLPIDPVYRKQLNLNHDDQISATSKAARNLLELINADHGLEPKLNVVVVSEQNGVVFRDTIRQQNLPSNARTVVIWDQGGHFEAIAPLHSVAQRN
jgi:hypothetical protein